MTVSLKDLKAKRAAMTQGEWKHRQVMHPNGEVSHDVVRDEGGRTIAFGSDGEEADFEERNATGIVATHNAADVLIEIAEAALAYEQAKIDAAVIRYTYATADDRRTVGAQRIEAHDRDEIRCREAYRAALAKIKP